MKFTKLKTVLAASALALVAGAAAAQDGRRSRSI